MTIIAKNLPDSDLQRFFLDESKRSAIQLESAVIGLGTYLPGWRWSLHAGPQIGKPAEHHIGYIISGSMMIRDAAGFEQEVGSGDAFEVTPGADAWVTGGEPCIALDFAHIDK